MSIALFINFTKFTNLPKFSTYCAPLATLTPQNPFVPWGFSPQAERLLSNN